LADWHVDPALALRRHLGERDGRGRHESPGLLDTARLGERRGCFERLDERVPGVALGALAHPPWRLRAAGLADEDRAGFRFRAQRGCAPNETAGAETPAVSLAG